MVYIPFPREAFDENEDLSTWRAKTSKRDGDWRTLKDFLAGQSQLIPDQSATPKCWYSEMLQGDRYALDVEHFRPKQKASPLDSANLKKLKLKTGFDLEQSTEEGAYPWLKFDYRNYRLVTAMTNRAGAKHVYFPIAKNSNRIATNAFPWETPEFPCFLDPTDPHDASLLLVKPNGEIIPRAPKTQLTDADFENLPKTWHADGFNYMRAEVTILMYNLDHRIFQEGRKKVYDRIVDLMGRLQDCLPDDQDRLVRLKDGFIADLVDAVSPSAPFSLAARCALEAYIPPTHLNIDLKNVLEKIPQQILDRVALEVSKIAINWHKP